MYKHFKTGSVATALMVALSASSAFASDLGNAIKKGGSYHLNSNQTLGSDEGSVSKNVTITGNGYGVTGVMDIRDANGDKASLTASHVGRATINDDYTVSVTNKWTADSGKSTLISRGDLVVTNNVFADNTAGAETNGKNGGAIQVLGAIDKQEEYQDASRETTVHINNNVFYKNKGYQGGAVDFDHPEAKVQQFNGNYFIENSATHHGGAVDFHSFTDEMNDNTFVRNTSVNGGALFAHSNTRTTGSGNKFIGNSATQNGGAVYVQEAYSGHTNLSNGTYTDNVAGQAGGAVYNAGVMTVSDSEFSGNKAQNGGAIYNDAGAQLYLSGNTFGSNTASGDGSDIYNAGTVSFSGNNTFASTSSDNALYNTGTFNINAGKTTFGNGINTFRKNKTGTVNVNNGGIMDIGTSAVYAKDVTFNQGATLVTHIQNMNDTNDKGAGTYGHIIAETVGVNTTDTEMQIVVGTGEVGKNETKRIHIIQTSDKMAGEFATLANNKKYDITAEGNGWYVIKNKEEDDNNDKDDDKDDNNNDNTIPSNPSDEDDKRTAKECHSIDCVDDVWVDEGLVDIPNDTVAKEVQKEFNRLTQFGTDEEVLDANYGIAPDLSPIIQAHAAEINRNLNNIVHNRLYGSMERTGYKYRNKRYYRFPRHESHLWVQGIAGKSEWDTERGFDGKTKGIAVGFDGKVSDATRMGIAYAYTIGEFDSIGRDTDIDSHTGMFYGEYNPNRFYANWMATYTRSAYEETKRVGNVRVGAEFDVDAVGAQVMVGRKVGPIVNGNWSTGVFMPEIGLRYLYTKQGDYTDDAAQRVEGQDGQTVTGLAGLQYTIGYKLSDTVSWYPELRAALTYDFVQADSKTRVNLANGNVYELEGEKLDKFGIELGARAGVDINRKAELSIEYDGVFQGDYTNHTGMANMKYKF